VERLNLTFGASNDLLDVIATFATVTTTINTGSGNDTIRLGDPTVNNILGPLIIDGGANAVGSRDVLILQDIEPAGLLTNSGFLGTPPNAALGAGFLGGFGMGGPNNNVKFANTESVQIFTGPSNDVVFLQFSTTPPRFGFSLNLDGGSDGVVFEGTDKNDRIHVSRRVGLDGTEVVALINGQTIVAGYQGGETVSVFAGAGNDHVTVDASVTTWRAELFGEHGNDHLAAGLLAALLDGGAGNDFLEGGAGDDELIGGAGNDFFDGGPGADRLSARDNALDVIFADLADLLLDHDDRDLVIRRRLRRS
jgi:Ca2+-binding RTX toxin-like protein